MEGEGCISSGVKACFDMHRVCARCNVSAVSLAVGSVTLYYAITRAPPLTHIHTLLHATCTPLQVSPTSAYTCRHCQRFVGTHSIFNCFVPLAFPSEHVRSPHIQMCAAPACTPECTLHTLHARPCTPSNTHMPHCLRYSPSCPLFQAAWLSVPKHVRGVSETDMHAN